MPSTRYLEDELDWGTDDDNMTDSTCEKAIVGSPETYERSMGTKQQSVSKTQDDGKPETTAQNASERRVDLPERRPVSIHNWSMKALSRKSTFCNEANVILIQEDTPKRKFRATLEGVPRTDFRFRFNPAIKFCRYVNIREGCWYQSGCSFDHYYEGTRCRKAEERRKCPNETCVFKHRDDYTPVYRCNSKPPVNITERRKGR
jgi:hypothetical protein